MKNRTCWMALAALLALALPAWAQEKITIKLRKSQQGDVSLVEKVEKGTEVANVVDNDNKVVQEQANKKTTSHYVYRETIVEKAAGAKDPTRLKRHYLKAEDIVDVAAIVSILAG